MSQTYTHLVEVKKGETLSLDGGRIVVKIEEKSGQRVRFRFEFKQQTEVRKLPPVVHEDRASLSP